MEEGALYGITVANLVTSIRFGLLFLLVALAYWATPTWQLVNPPLLVLIIWLDALDGYIARTRGETSLFGSVYDIAVDRVVENVLWIVLADLDLIPVWVAIAFVVRGVIVDSIRAEAVSAGQTPFGMMQSRWGRVLVAGRFMRAFYGTIKAAAFAWLLLLQPLPALAPGFWSGWQSVLSPITMTLVLGTLVVSIARGVPVVIQMVASGFLGARPPVAAPRPSVPGSPDGGSAR